MIATLDAHIVQTPEILGGKPRIAGHRITVAQIVAWHELMGLSADEIATTYQLSLGDVYAALAYYFDHQAEVDQISRESEQFTNDLEQSTVSKILKKRG
ncbi:MAG: DUF433 domain-containing protein [Rudanella sp.]|nr:DUF433 domain-containing protein [Rudanella sp.]